MAVIAQAPVAFSKYTSLTGTGEQILQVSSAGVTAGMTAGNFYLDAPPSNILNGKVFTVRMAGWLKAHGASQTVAVGLLWSAWSAGSRSATTADTFTIPTVSHVLVAGTYYNFSIVQQFYGDSSTNALTAILPAVYSMWGNGYSVVTATTPLAVTFNSASQTEPGTGFSEVADQNYPLVSFMTSITNSVADTVETCQLTQFQLEL